MNILITGIGGPTPRSIAKRVRQLYPDSTIVGVDANRKAIGFYISGLTDVRLVVPRADHPDYWQSIKNVIREYAIDFAFIQPELEVIQWGLFREKTGHYPCPTFIPPLALAQTLMNKAVMSELLESTAFIPRTLRITPQHPRLDEIEAGVGYPCWIRATVGSGGLGSLKLNSRKDLEAWLLIHAQIQEFTVSEFLPGRHLANQMMYLDGTCIGNAGLECVEYVMADVAPSKVTGNTSFGRFVNEPELLTFCEQCVSEIAARLGVVPHGVLSFDLKEDALGALKVTEINIRHMAYTGIMAAAGFDLVGDTILYLTGRAAEISGRGAYFYEKDYIFLRDVDIEPILMRESEL